MNFRGCSRLLVLGLLAAALIGVDASAMRSAGTAPSRIALVSCVNTRADSEHGALNRCLDVRRLRFDHLAVGDRAVYTSDEDEALEFWPVTADGKLSAGSCFMAYRSQHGCALVPEPFRPRDLAVSPDGRHLYVLNWGAAISIFDVGANGEPVYRDCVGLIDLESSCSTRIPGSSQGFLASFHPIASPDGSRLYLLDYRGLISFRRSPDGRLEYLGCLRLARSVCEPDQTMPFVAESAGIAVSPDSRFVYVVGGTYDTYKVKGQNVDAITVLERIDSAPGIRLAQTLKLPLWGTGSDRVGDGSAAVSSDGRHLYATVKNRLVTLARNQRNGTVRLLGCMGSDSYSYDTMRCADVRLSEPSRIVLSRSGSGAAVAHRRGLLFFGRNAATGALGRKTKRGVQPLACASTDKGSGACDNDIPFQGWPPEHIVLSTNGSRLFATTWVSQVLASVTSPLGGSSARSLSGPTVAAVDHRLGINNWMVGPTRETVRVIYRGLELRPLTFALGLDVLSEHGSSTPTTETVRITLPDGLTWGTAPASAKTMRGGHPDYWSFTPTAEACTVEGTVATCRAEGVPHSTRTFGWILDVTARAPGLYKVHGEIVPPTDGRNRVPRGAQTPPAADVNLIVGERSGAVTVSRVTLSRPRPSLVRATTAIRQGGVPVRPDSLSCTSSFVSVPSYGKRTFSYPKDWLARLPLGEVTCVHGFNNSRYRGETLAGEILFSVGKAKVRRTYTVRIGAGTTLTAPTGAVVEKRR